MSENPPNDQTGATPASQSALTPTVLSSAAPTHPSSPTSSNSPYPAQAMSNFLQKPLTLAVGVLAVLLAAQWWTANNEIRNLREEMANRLRTTDVTTTETRVIATTVQERTKELITKFSVLENKQAEAQNQQLALEQLYQDLSKNRDDWALAEIEQVLSTASQQLQLAGNVQGALIALQNADRTLSRSDKPQFISIRRVIAKDMEKLKSLPNLDLPGLALRLDSVISQIDNLPLVSDEKPAQISLPPKKPVIQAAPKVANAKGTHGKDGKDTKDAKVEEPGMWAQWGQALEDHWNSFSSEMWLEVQQLIRVRSVETPVALMMSPSQAYFAKENVKLRLLNARLALLSRNEVAFRNDLSSAQDSIAKFFDTRAKQTQTALTLLKAVQGSNLSIEMPNLGESLAAVRNYKAKP